MKIERFEEIEAWQIAGELTKEVYIITKQGAFSKDWPLRDQIRAAAGSTMHNTAEGFDAGSNAEFIRFLRYSQRSCTEVQSQLYVAADQRYITQQEFEKIYDLASRTRSACGGFIRYLEKNPRPSRTKNDEPRTTNQAS